MKFPETPLRFGKKMLVVLLAGMMCSTSMAQTLFGSMNGVISIAGDINGTAVTASSKELQITLDYDYAIFEMRLPLNSLYSGISFLDSEFAEMKENDLLIQGQLGVHYINTNQHPKQHFVFSGKLKQLNKTIDLKGTGHLEHVDGVGKFACLLGLTFEVDPEGLQLGSLGYGKLNVQIRQTVLNPLDSE